MKGPNQQEREREIFAEVEADVTVPWLYRWTKISHYYGDSVRQLFIAAAATMLIGAPFYTNNLGVELPFIVLGTVALVSVAAVTNPFKIGVISADAVAAGVGLVIFEIWALGNYQTDPLHMFVIREALALIFLFALYFSTKTLRSMFLDKVGKPDSPREFTHPENPLTPDEEELLDWKEGAKEALHEMNEREKHQFND